MLRIRKHREAASGGKAASVSGGKAATAWARSGQPSNGAEMFARAAGERRTAASVKVAPRNVRLAAPELTASFANRQLLS